MSRIFERPATPDLAYFAFAGLITVFVSAIHLFDPLNVYSYVRDLWHHLASINALMDSPFSATNPHVVSDEPSRTFMPWYLLLALFGKAFNLNAFQVLGVSALLSMITLTAGVRLFAREYFHNDWAPLVLLAALVGGWGIEFNYAGLSNLETLIVSASYPFAIVLGLGFIGWWAVLRLLGSEKPNPWLLALVIGLSWFMFTTHQMQAGLSIGAMLLFAGLAGKASLARRAVIMAAVIAGVLLTSLWIYYNPIAFVFHNTIEGWETGKFWYNKYFLLFLTAVGVFGIMGFYDYQNRKIRWDLLIGTLAIFTGFVVGGILGNPVSHRFYPFGVLFLHLGLTGFLVSWPYIKNPGSFRGFPRFMHYIAAPLLAVLVVFHLFVGVRYYLKFSGYGDGTVEIDYPAGDPNILRSVAGVSKLVGPGDVIIANYGAAYPVQAHGMKVVSIPRPFPLVHDMAERQQASSDFFKVETTDGRRLEIIEKYNVTHILYRNVWTGEDIRQILDNYGEKFSFHDDLVLIVIDLSKKPGPNSGEQTGIDGGEE